MKISQDVRDRFGGGARSATPAMKEKSAEFLELGGTVYVEPQTTLTSAD